MITLTVSFLNWVIETGTAGTPPAPPTSHPTFFIYGF